MCARSGRGADDDAEAVARVVAELEEAADGLAAMLRSLTDVRVAMLVDDVVGAGEVGVYEGEGAGGAAAAVAGADRGRPRRQRAGDDAGLFDEGSS